MEAESCPFVFGEPALKLEFHHINYVSKDVDGLQRFYIDILKMEPIAPQNFPRTTASKDAGYDGNIKFATEGSMQMHLAERDLDVAARNGQHINPVERGHIAFRTDDIDAFKQHLRDNDIAFADYGTAFAAEWHQIFFHDPEGNIIEVHQQVG
jgi:glyoxylase I family protein